MHNASIQLIINNRLPESEAAARGLQATTSRFILQAGNESRVDRGLLSTFMSIVWEWRGSDESVFLTPLNPFARESQIKLVAEMAGCGFTFEPNRWCLLSCSNRRQLGEMISAVNAEEWSVFFAPNVSVAENYVSKSFNDSKSGPSWNAPFVNSLDDVVLAIFIAVKHMSVEVFGSWNTVLNRCVLSTLRQMEVLIL